MKIKHMGNIKLKKYNWINSSEKGKIINTVSKKELQNIISNYKYLNAFLKFKDNMNIYSYNPRDLLSPYNFDVFAKYIYIYAKMNNLNNDFFEKLYLNHIYAFNKYQEPDGSKKNKYDFLYSFNKLIADLKDKQINNIILPISKQNILIDGSHRLAISLYNKSSIECVKFDIEDMNFNYLFFKERKLKSLYLDYMAFWIKDLVPNCKCTIIEYNTKKQKANIIYKLHTMLDIYYIKNSNIDMQKINMLLNKNVSSSKKSKILFILYKGIYKSIDNELDIEVLSKLFLFKNSISFINKTNINKLKNLIEKDSKETINYNNYSPKDIYFLKNKAYLKRR